jgi:flagellar protein FliO/FliZ
MESPDLTRFVLAFVFVVGLIGLSAMLLKRYGARYRLSAINQPDARLKVVEIRYIDPRRKLVLVKRDGVEHLLLLADGRETVIETRIGA